MEVHLSHTYVAHKQYKTPRKSRSISAPPEVGTCGFTGTEHARYTVQQGTAQSESLPRDGYVCEPL